MLSTILRRTLALPHGHAPAHLSAASGLVRVGGRLYVVADDEHALGCFALAGDTPGSLLPLLGGELPDAPDARKAAKPDLEALLALPGPGGGAGALLALGSGSRPQRQRGVLCPLDAAGAPAGAPRVLDLAPLYAPLHARFGRLNIEGGFVAGAELVLLQRANRGAPVNASIGFDAAALQAWLAGCGDAPAPHRITEHALGTLDGVPLGFTDGVALPEGGWLYSAAAEDTADAYVDGDCAGSVIGAVDATGAPAGTWRLDRRCKVEGLALARDADARGLLMVTDADDRALPALLLAAAL